MTRTGVDGSEQDTDDSVNIDEVSRGSVHDQAHAPAGLQVRPGEIRQGTGSHHPGTQGRERHGDAQHRDGRGELSAPQQP
eukprot:1850307-Heterocapsa_arctica.AAC.1